MYTKRNLATSDIICNTKGQMLGKVSWKYHPYLNFEAPYTGRQKYLLDFCINVLIYDKLTQLKSWIKVKIWHINLVEQTMLFYLFPNQRSKFLFETHLVFHLRENI